MAFDKYEGLGNDFVVVEATAEWTDASRAVRLCDRHFGIGADGVLLVLPPTSAEARARMVVQNADGSRPEMCGNGLRCVALHLARRDNAGGATYVVDTDAGPLVCEVDRDGDIAQVAVDMGRGKPEGEHRSEHEGREIRFRRVSMGNPHAIVFDAGYSEDDIDRIGPRVSSEIPGGCNVEFATRKGARHIELVVWERGVGRTLACGTGAAATAVAAALAGHAPFGEPLSIDLPGGTLEVAVEPETLAVRVRGPARRVFAGQVWNA